MYYCNDCETTFEKEGEILEDIVDSYDDNIIGTWRVYVCPYCGSDDYELYDRKVQRENDKCLKPKN